MRAGEEEEGEILMFTDSYDVIFAAGEDSIMAEYMKMGGGVLFGAEGFCWPNKHLASKVT